MNKTIILCSNRLREYKNIYIHTVFVTLKYSVTLFWWILLSEYDFSLSDRSSRSCEMCLLENFVLYLFPCLYQECILNDFYFGLKQPTISMVVTKPAFKYYEHHICALWIKHQWLKRCKTQKKKFNFTQKVYF